VGEHGGGEAGIVDFDPGDAVLHDEATPLAVNSIGVCQSEECFFDLAGVVGTFFDRQSEAIACEWGVKAFQNSVIF